MEVTRGDFEADILIDATGWRAVLAQSISPRYFHMPFLLPLVVRTYVAVLNPAARRRAPDSAGVRVLGAAKTENA
jgi:flavin-dependent dehydrogenase